MIVAGSEISTLSACCFSLFVIYVPKIRPVRQRKHLGQWLPSFVNDYHCSQLNSNADVVAQPTPTQDMACRDPKHAHHIFQLIDGSLPTAPASSAAAASGGGYGGGGGTSIGGDELV